MEKPNVVTTVTVKGTKFIFHAQAYRKLTDAEMKHAIRLWKAQNKISKVPKIGEVTVIATHESLGEYPL